MIDALIWLGVELGGLWGSGHVRRAAMAAGLALSAIVAMLLLGDASWGSALVVLGVAALFWILMTILDVTVGLPKP